MRKNMAKPARVFKFPYQITAATYQSGEEESQHLAVGMIDGSIIVIDLALGIEKYFLEKHPAGISALAFFEDRVLVSGSIDGRINLVDLDSEHQSKVYKCQNCQDRRIPVAKILVSDYGICTAIDIEGNCRFYDLIRLKKLCKISCRQSPGANEHTWRMVPEPCMVATPDAFLAVIQTQATEDFDLESAIAEQ